MSKDLESIIVMGAALDVVEVGMCGWMDIREINTRGPPWLLLRQLDVLCEETSTYEWIPLMIDWR